MWVMFKVFIWFCCELFIGIVCVCFFIYVFLVRCWWKGELLGYLDMFKVYMLDKFSLFKVGYKISGRKYYGGLDVIL